MLCKIQNTKKYKTRDSPPYPAQECKGKQKKGNDGKLYKSESDTRGIYRWKCISTKTKKNKKTQSKKRIIHRSKYVLSKTKKVSDKPKTKMDTHLKVKGEKSYLIHSNGARPYIVYVSPKKVTAFFREYDSTRDKYDETKKVVDTEYDNVFIGDNEDNLQHYDSFKGQDPGNTILIHTKNNDYIFIGDDIYSFSTPNDEKITHYYSPLGNNDVPYPFAVSNNYTYFMLDKVKLPNQIISLDNKDSPFYKDRYSQFYGFHIEDKKERKKWEKMIKEMKEPYRTKLVHSP
jgi:hypothetical protein